MIETREYPAMGWSELNGKAVWMRQNDPRYNPPPESDQETAWLEAQQEELMNKDFDLESENEQEEAVPLVDVSFIQCYQCFDHHDHLDPLNKLIYKYIVTTQECQGGKSISGKYG